MEEKKFIIRCLKCRWVQFTTGQPDDLKGLYEIKGCGNCGKPREFRCPKCGKPAKMLRTEGNSRGTTTNEGGPAHVVKGV